MYVKTIEQLAKVVDDYLQHDAFVFDVETVPQDFEHDAWRGDPLRNRVVWLALATDGRADVIPFGHPNGEYIRSEWPLNAEGRRREQENVTRAAEGKKLLLINDRYHRLTAAKHEVKNYSEAPEQLSWTDDVKRELNRMFKSYLLKVGHNVKFDKIGRAHV